MIKDKEYVSPAGVECPVCGLSSFAHSHPPLSKPKDFVRLPEKEYRSLSGVFFREKVGEKWENICFEELSEASQDRILNEKNPEFVKNLCKIMANTVRDLGEKFDITTE